MFRNIWTTLGVALLLAAPLGAHHPFGAEYDWKKPVTITGTVTRFEWVNPHSHMFVDVKDRDGKTATWDFELGGATALEKAGWMKSTVKAGDTVTVDAWMAKTKNSAANMKTLKLPDGRELSAASSIADPNANETPRRSSN
jgi:hypothetical protein